MPGDYAPVRMHEHLLALSREAFASRLYITAYYSLAAAMHCASNVAQFAEIEAIAQEQLNWLDTHEPTHDFSSNSVAKRGIGNPWATLEQRARTKRWLLEQEPMDEPMGRLS